ncbi:HWE histidine kinase domain-containing protein [Rhizobium sp. BK251]|uniref:HWE histidine kinase domain-containing protein n=1 Tax=Rhizobium sp. BK251 TaxID=2512125 RepID=UPI001FE0707C|nr:HWE histidine kinase domain-containing protein [Rhizobium sp. BK251]
MAISKQTLGREGTGQDEVDAFRERLTSMAKAHDLLTHRDWQRADLSALVSKSWSPIPQNVSRSKASLCFCRRRQSSRFLWLSTSSRRMLQSTAHCRLLNARSRSPGGLATVMRARKQGYISGGQNTVVPQ